MLSPAGSGREVAPLASLTDTVYFLNFSHQHLCQSPCNFATNFHTLAAIVYVFSWNSSVRVSEVAKCNFLNVDIPRMSWTVAFNYGQVVQTNVRKKRAHQSLCGVETGD